MADLVKYVILERVDDERELWEPIGTAEAATREKALEMVAPENASATDAFRIVPESHWGEEQNVEVTVVRQVKVKPAVKPKPAPTAKAPEAAHA